ncbi:MAG: hypothetical protein H3C47_09600 [Candidatus Cloacimonetes bacterium]|nr:hypothetical protein [Candidatus Cloacimonadota bacterium]
MDKPSENSWIQTTLSQQILELTQENEALKAELNRLPDTKSTNNEDSSEIRRLEDIIKDLESQLLRYRSRWYFVVFQWIFQFINVWLVRFPLAILLLFFHITAIFSHRFFARNA